MIYEKLNSVGERNLLFPAIVYSMRLVKIDVVKGIFKDLPSPIKSDVMTAYDTLLKEGMEKGMEKGIEKAVINLFKRQFDINQIADIMEIHIDKVKNILKKQNKN